MRALGVAFQGRRASEEDSSDREAVLDKPSSGDESVTAVVALARHDEHIGCRVGKSFD